MARKLMIYPSARSKSISEKGQKLLFNTLLVVALYMVFQSWYVYSFMHAVKLMLMIGLSIITTIEFETLFYSLVHDISREQSKELIAKSYPHLTGLMFALLLPLGTPLWLVVIGAVLATLVGKLLFGGYHHMVFHTALVGFLFVTMGFNDLAVSAEFTTSFDNYLLQLVFDNDFFNQTLSISDAFDPSATQALFLDFGSYYKITPVLFGLVPGVLTSGVVILVAFGFLLYKKVFNWIIPVTSILSFVFTAFFIAVGSDYNIIEFVLYQLFGGMFLFVVVFFTTDPITTPIPTIGKVIFGALVGPITMFIRLGSEFGNNPKYIQGVVFAVLFMSMLSPMLNVEFGKKKKVPRKDPKPPVKKEDK